MQHNRSVRDVKMLETNPKVPGTVCGSWSPRLQIRSTTLPREKAAGPTFQVEAGLMCAVAVMLGMTEIVKR
jgi:hypothetical protein